MNEQKKREIGERIAQIRKQSGLTQTEFGEILGMDKKAISALERGRNALTINNIIKIHRAFRVSYKYIIDGI